ncbi:TonB-dependent receptor [Candidatus Venteria ishoeyi]|uniref:TonB-dependent receptor plug domain-containing protein n=1 Tax=Candidatus Venteria ishoeyi TaxID=1899563 RepID=UPI0025A59D92|nr:TonB-dependent receptor [Candidatus Venteria ishoeyi]MDM8546898.1 TonB-dependent receptor [Candidatus Venteria ishoeyi]
MKYLVNYLALFTLFHIPFVYSKDKQINNLLGMSLEELMNVETSISTNSKQKLSTAPAAVTLITAEDIKATGATNLADILKAVPGIYVRYNHFGLRPLIGFRGSNSKQTLVMINGSSVGDLMWRLGIFWKGLPVNMIERVEIIRGPGSALFGTDASAGVINVITKTAGIISRAEVGLRSGSFNTQTAWMEYGGQWNGFDVAMTAGLFRTDGHDPLIASDAQSRRDRTSGSHASLAPGVAQFGWKNNDLHLSLTRKHWRLQADYMQHDDLEIGLTGAGALDPVTKGKDSYLELGLFYENEQFDKNWGLETEIRYRRVAYSSGDGFQEWPPGFSDSKGTYPDGVLNHMESAEHRLNTEVSGLYHGIKNHAIRLGGGYSWHDLYYVKHLVNFGNDANGTPLPAGGSLVDISNSAYAFAPEKTRSIYYLFLQDVWRISDDWELTAGLRYDYYSDFGNALNPRFALVWQTNNKLTTKLMYGQAFRAPGFQELFAETSFTLPNSELDPEHSETWELSLAYALNKNIHLGMNLYHFKQSDFISAHSIPGLSKRKYQNSGEHIIHGVELEAWWQPLENLRLTVNYNYRDPDESPFRAIGTPKQLAYFRTDWRFLPHWNWNMQSNWIGTRNRRANDQRADLDAYWNTDTTLRYHGINKWEFSVSARNLFNVDGREYTGASIPDDLPLPGRSFHAEMRYRF